MKKERPLISFDWAMKKMLRQKANHEILNGFLSELLRFDVRITEVLESESNKENAEDKYNRIDIVARNQDNGVILIELQYNYEIDFIHRMLYGSSKTIVDYMTKNNQYLNIQKVYSINILYFPLGHGSDYIYHGTTSFRGIHKKDLLAPSILQTEKLGISEIFEIFPEYYIIRIKDFDGDIRDTLDQWIFYFKNNAVEPQFKAKGLDLVREKLVEDALSDQEKIDLEYHKERLSNLNSAIFTALDTGFYDGIEKGMEKGMEKGREEGLKEGIEKGREEGIKEGKLETARELKKCGVNIEFIKKSTGLSEAEIEKI